jgi:hypothetical protein
VHHPQDEVGSWEGRLSTLLEGLTLLQAIQRRWLYLAPIFGRGALPAVAGRFRHVDGEFRAIMAALQVCGVGGGVCEAGKGCVCAPLQLQPPLS